MIFGGDFLGATTFLGTAGADNPIGTAAAETFVLGQDDDTATGNGGADAFQGGIGNDIIAVADASFIKADGGGGQDTLLLDFAGVIDFGNLDGNAATSERGRIVDIEIIDVTNGSANATILSLADLLDLDVDNVDALGTATDNVLAILGDAGDTLVLVDPSGDAFAASGGAFLDDGVTYQLYVGGPDDALKVAVDTDILVAPS